jgi:hypothetical protein
MTKFYLKTQFSENINVYNGALERFCETRKWIEEEMGIFHEKERLKQKVMGIYYKKIIKKVWIHEILWREKSTELNKLNVYVEGSEKKQ